MNKLLKTIIIDDEAIGLQRLKRLLTGYQLFDVVAEASNGREGLELIESLKPDVIFLDIEMPVMNGFDMLRLVMHHPKVIFTTAFDQYAIKAFEENSIDYLLKPIEKDRLDITVNKLQSAAPFSPDLKMLQGLIDSIKPKAEIKTITVHLGDKIMLVKLEDIAYIEAEDKYVFLHDMDGLSHLTDFTMNHLEEHLPEKFVRIHRSFILNIEAIKEIRKSFNGSLVFTLNDKNFTRLNSSRSYSSNLRERFSI
ncbi:MAG: LytR/AlgR family response regulator transcription factor [Sphingobacteriaceae bacterium]